MAELDHIINEVLLSGMMWDKSYLERLMYQPDFLKVSSTYESGMKILAALEQEYRLKTEGKREMLAKFAHSRFGDSTSLQQQQFDAIVDGKRLDRLADGLAQATNWDEWLATP